ncbi:hypothetical protein T03_11426 [Trichinella britovi]|uniref:Uncharacterized protein n=1 Tax=Trichinella britovi TaxID=45882 RepID=A0A0V1C809_TRIBR|nr:hypothetical protein T03_11426 [Trichinella britovi]
MFLSFLFTRFTPSRVCPLSCSSTAYALPKYDHICISKNRHKPIYKGRCHTHKCTNHNDKYGL